jgi:arabinogalactan oligomer / maltooligosaccharide transport system permease protein
MITRRPNLTAYTFLSPALIMTALLVFLPLFWGIGISFTNYNQYNAGKKFDTSYQTDRSKYDFGYVGLDNYKRILIGNKGLFQGREVQRFLFIFWQTALWTVVNVFFHFIFGLGLALLLNRRMKGRAIYRMLLLIPWAVPVYVSAFSWRRHPLAVIQRHDHDRGHHHQHLARCTVHDGGPPRRTAVHPEGAV